MHFFIDLVWRVSGVFLIYLIGHIIESDGRRIDNIPSRKEVLLNSAHVFVYHAADLSIGVMTIYYLELFFDKIHYKAPIRFHGGALSVLALSFLAVAAHDFFYYWLHRLQHSSKWLWAEHELHHSDEHMNVTTSWRHHWLDTVLQPLFIYPPIFLLFNPSLGPVIWLVAFSKLIGYFVHLNFPLRFGWFNRVLTSPQAHRIHHSNLPEHIDKNFATAFPIWDILFGTYYHPKKEDWPSTGVTGVKVTSLWQAIVMPFVSWGKMLRHDQDALVDLYPSGVVSGDLGGSQDAVIDGSSGEDSRHSVSVSWP